MTLLSDLDHFSQTVIEPKQVRYLTTTNTTNKNTTVQLLVLFTSSNPWDRAEESDATFTRLVLPLEEPSEE